MSPHLRPRSWELDDDSLLNIFSKVGCARELAKMSLVSKRWDDLSNAVSYLSFDFKGTTKDIRTKEGIISSVLCRASMRAPGNLKHLRVSLGWQDEPAEVHGHWLQWTTSLTKLELTVYYSLQWGPGVWNSIMRMTTLEELRIGRKFSTEKHLLLPQVLANGLGMPRLQYCKISCNINTLETILATCPELTELCAFNTAEELTGSFRVASNSLKIFKFYGCNRARDGFEATIHAPSLTTLKLLTGSEPISIYFESAQSLQTLTLESSSKLYSPPENLQKIKLEGESDIQELLQMLKLTPMITDLYLKHVGITGEGRIDIDQIVAPLVNLRNIYLGCEVISQFQTGKKRFEGLTVHIWPGSSTSLLIQLIEDHKIQSLVVHCKDMFDCQTKAIIKSYEEWRFLFDLSYFYPDRVKLVS